MNPSVCLLHGKPQHVVRPLHFKRSSHVTKYWPCPEKWQPHWILPLPRKVTLQHHTNFNKCQMQGVPSQVRMQLHQILCLPGKSDIATLPNTAPATKSHTSTSPNIARAMGSDAVTKVFLQRMIPSVDYCLTAHRLNSSLTELLLGWTPPWLTELCLGWIIPWLNKSLSEPALTEPFLGWTLLFLDWSFLDWGSPWLNHSLAEVFLDRSFLGWTFAWLNHSLIELKSWPTCSLPWLSCFLTELIVFYEWFLAFVFFFRGDLFHLFIWIDWFA